MKFLTAIAAFLLASEVCLAKTIVECEGPYAEKTIIHILDGGIQQISPSMDGLQPSYAYSETWTEDPFMKEHFQLDSEYMLTKEDYYGGPVIRLQQKINGILITLSLAAIYNDREPENLKAIMLAEKVEISTGKRVVQGAGICTVTKDK